MPRTPTTNLTAARVESLRTDKVQQDFADHQVPGLAIRVSGSTGRKTWMLGYRLNGKPRRLKIGTYPHLSLREARDRALTLKGEVEEGKDPAHERDERRAGRGTFRELAEEAIRAKEAKGRRASTIRGYRQIVEADLLPAWGGLRAADVSRRDVVLLVEKVADRAPVMAQRTLAVIRLIFNEGIRRGFPGIEANPAHLVEPPTEARARDRYLTGEEVGQLWRAAKAETPGVGWAFHLALLTAQRMGNVAALRWDEIEGGVWTIPAKKFKGKRSQMVPLSKEAQEVVTAVRASNLSKDWLFPARPGAKTSHLRSWGAATKRLRRSMRVEDWRAHDFRTTFRTWAVRSPKDAGLGVPAQVADAILGHKEMSLGFGHYTGDRESYLLAEKREAMEEWGRWVLATVRRDAGET